nr:MAG TPA: hypothetical protein [Caudoviricetes sp.]
MCRLCYCLAYNAKSAIMGAFIMAGMLGSLETQKAPIMGAGGCMAETKKRP